MSNDRRARSSTDEESERALRRLFAHAKPRPMPPEADAEEIRRAVYAEWDVVTGKRVVWRRAGFAAAASVVLAAALWVGFATDLGAPLPAVARVERFEGPADGAAGEPFLLGSTLAAGDVVATGDGPVALRLATGGSLRVGPQSRVVLTGRDATELVAGVLYFDSEGRRAGVEFAVTTSLGEVRDVGTQFLARLDSSAGRLDVGVRNGRIELTSGAQTGAAGVGERLVLTRDVASISRDTIATFGGEWDWVERVAPPFDTDGHTVSDFLVWLAEQTGRTVVFGSPDAERVARVSVISGSLDLAPLQRLVAVLDTADLAYSLDGERVVIDTR
jgi:hypothetical protein